MQMVREESSTGWLMYILTFVVLDDRGADSLCRHASRRPGDVARGQRAALHPSLWHLNVRGYEAQADAFWSFVPKKALGSCIASVVANLKKVLGSGIASVVANLREGACFI